MPRTSRPAFTLFELLLVLALLIVIGAIAAPAIGRFSQTQQLRSSAEVVRGVWARARVQAMKSGRVQAFRFVPNEAYYDVQYWAADDDALEAIDDGGHASVGGQPIKGQTPELPEGVKFASVETELDARGQQIAADVEDGDVARARWSAPVLFYADGTTSSAELVLVNRRGTAVRVALRGLTGVARVSEAYTQDDKEASP
ncbi:MAG: hypothetical protein KDA41_05915 [Planctomycetales bacterium]|nr:hypothetical protein [Planctomycetales bacterium]